MPIQADEPIFTSGLWTRALDRYARAVQLTVTLYNADAQSAVGPVNPTPLFHLFYETKGYDPGLFDKCALQCLTQTPDRSAVIVSFYGLTVVGTSLMLDRRIVGAVVGGYALLDFARAIEIQRLARNASIPFDKLWLVARQQRPVPRRALILHGELLQILGDALLNEISRARQFGLALNRTEAELRALTLQLLDVQEDERRRLARELHDDTVQKLVLLQNNIARLRLGLSTNMSQVGEHLQEIEHQLRSISEGVRNLSHQLHPSIIEDLGLEVALRTLIDDFARQTSNRARFQVESLPGNISSNVATTLYRVTQEALENVRKHAGNASVGISLGVVAGNLCLAIEDNGLGFDAQNVGGQGLGFISMQERAQSVDGRLHISSRPGYGVRIEVTIPSWENG